MNTEQSKHWTFKTLNIQNTKHSKHWTVKTLNIQNTEQSKHRTEPESVNNRLESASTTPGVLHWNQGERKMLSLGSNICWKGESCWTFFQRLVISRLERLLWLWSPNGRSLFNWPVLLMTRLKVPLKIAEKLICCPGHFWTVPAKPKVWQQHN